MFRNSIKSAVMKVLKEKIANVQEVHDSEIDKENQDHEVRSHVLKVEFQKRSEILQNEHVITKRAITESHVNAILSKIL